MNKKIIMLLLIVFAAFILGGGVFYYFKFIQGKNQNSASVVVEKASDFPKPSGSVKTNEKVLIYKKIDQGNEIIQSDLSKNKNKLVFSDRDENLKINLTGGFAYLKNEVLVYLGSDRSGKLAVINLGDSAQIIINESFAKPQALAISPDGQTITYAITNQETNQSSIYQMARDGSNKRQLLTSEKIITDLAFNKKADKIIYLSNSANDKSSIEILDINSLKNNQIYSSSNQILSLQYLPSDQIVFSEGINGQIKTGRVMVINSDGGSLKKIFETKKDFPFSAKVSSDFLTTAFVLINYQDKLDRNLSGEADFIKVGDEAIFKIESGNLIIGWQS